MTWHDLVFLHWPVEAARLRPHVPEALEIDAFDGTAWLGVVAFRMSRVGAGLLAAIPRISAFPEVNVRTYVTHRGRPGVWFASLDAADPLAVRAARRLFHLPYFDARMSCRARRHGWREYTSTRVHRGAPPASLRARYRPRGEPFEAKPGSLERFLTDRLSLFAADREGRIRRGDVAHAPWPLQDAEVDLEDVRMTEALGIALDEAPRSVLFARLLDVVASPLAPPIT
jgi:uncharacterized protein YqjF (DUF2071 family)